MKVIYFNLFLDEKKQKEKVPIENLNDKNVMFNKKWILSFQRKEKTFNYGPFSTRQTFSALKAIFNKNKGENVKKFMVADIQEDIWYSPSIIYEKLSQFFEDNKENFPEIQNNNNEKNCLEKEKEGKVIKKAKESFSIMKALKSEAFAEIKADNSYLSNKNDRIKLENMQLNKNKLN
jgi:hypothetical protein